MDVVQPIPAVGRRFKARSAFLLLVWCVGSGLAYRAMLAYETTPGRAAASVPAEWPAASTLPRNPGKPVLVMAAHPECPCSKASVAEIAELLVRHPDKMTCYVVFATQPGAGVGADACRASDLWKKASAIPGVTCLVDDRNELTNIFGARTSGHVFLYDGQGKLCFNGGITAGRDHVGSNPGIDALAAFLDTGKATIQSTPVFGCALR